MNVETHPQLTINNQTFRGDFEGSVVATALCASFRKRPDVCINNKFDSLISLGDDDFAHAEPRLIDNFIFQLFICGFIIVFVNVAMVLIHKKFQVKNQTTEIKQEVNEAVA
mmetsp:Transcript_11475/g.19416  ORF Transcript_11475/g.19416 Transcript_11475/m.19416 type:complete len:111 (-) Transcript_11475:103-435(-)